jgi:hypothetical protein
MNKRDVTVLTMLDQMTNQLGTLMMHLNEACLNLTLVKLTQYSVEVADCYKPIDTSMGYFMDKSTYPSQQYDLLEYLQLFEDGTVGKRTLVLFVNEIFSQEAVDILCKLQNQKSVTVILVSFYDDILSMNQFPRHLKFLITYDREYRDSLFSLKQLVDVIKNPNFDRFEYDRNLATFKNRSCLKNVKAIPFFSRGGAVTWEFEFRAFMLQFVNLLKSYNHELLTVHPLVDATERNSLPLPYSHVGKHHSQLRRLSFSELKETGIFEGNKQTVFILIYIKRPYPMSAYRRISSVESLLRQYRQTFIRVTVSFFRWVHSSFAVRGERNVEGYKFDINYVMDELVKAGCK